MAEAILTIRRSGGQRTPDGRLKWEEYTWVAAIDAADTAAVHAEVSRCAQAYLSGRPLAAVQWNPETCARPSSGLH